MAQPEEILGFWFGRPGEEGYGQYRKEWFGPAPEFNEGFRQRFAGDFEKAAAGKLSEWESTPEGTLALVLLLDQGSSMLYRGEGKAFASDALARRIAGEAIDKGFDRRFPDFHRWFFYLPFEHSEDLEDQERAVALFSGLEPNETNAMGVEYAVRHKRVIERFGRFPNRNAALGRESTPEELEFLAGPDAPY